MTIVGRLLRRSGVQALIKSEDFWGAWARGEEDLSPLSVAGTRVTRDSAQAISAVWACRNLIAATIASLPADVFFRREGARRPFRPKPRWVNEPNAEQTRFGLIEQTLDSLLLDGTAYLFTPRDRSGQVTEVWVVHPSHVRPYRQDGQVLYDVSAPEVGTVTLRGGIAGEMFHIPAYAPPGALRGMAPIEVARVMLGAGLAAQEFSARFFGQGLHMAGVIEEAGELTTEQARELKRDFARANSGLKGAHLPAVLTGTAKWKPITMTAEQAQFLETRRFSKEDIATFFLVPPHLIALVDKTTSWGAGIEEQNIGFVTYTLRQWIERIEQSFTRYLLWDLPGVFFKFNVDGLMRGNYKTRQEGLAIRRQWGTLNADDWRRLEDEPPLPDGKGQVYIIPSNFTPAPSPGEESGQHRFEHQEEM